MKIKLGASLPSLAGILISGLVTSACNNSMSAQQIAEAASYKLRAPVFLWAFNNDTCAYQQLSSLFNEYNSWNGAGERALTEKFKAFKALVVLESRNAGPTTGELVQLQLLNNKGYLVSIKTLRDTRTTPTGMFAGTSINLGNPNAVEGRVLELQPTFSEDRSQRTVYSTYSSDFYNATQAVDGAFAEALKDPRTVRVARKSDTNSTSCGKLARYPDFF